MENESKRVFGGVSRNGEFFPHPYPAACDHRFAKPGSTKCPECQTQLNPLLSEIKAEAFNAGIEAALEAFPKKRKKKPGAIRAVFGGKVTNIPATTDLDTGWNAYADQAKSNIERLKK